MSTILEVRNLKKYFNTKNGLLHAVDNVSFSIEEGRTLGVVGESGCGKSTLGRVVLHLLPATEGQILFCGEDISNPKKAKLHELRRNMQMVFQDPYSSLNPRQSVAEIIGEPLKVYHVCKSKQELDERVREIMDTVGLPERYQHSYPHELDGGRRQRIGIGRALALNPKFIVCDEPVSALDVSIQAQILFSCQLHPYTKALLSAIPIAKPNLDRKRIALKGELTSPIEPPKMCRFAPRCPYATERCFQEEPALEEVLPRHFVSCHRVKEINQL